MSQETAQAELATPLEDAATAQQPVAAKKGPGRPKGRGNSAKTTGKKSAANGNSATSKPASRAKKSTKQATENSTQSKGRGRPAGARNKASSANASSNDEAQNTNRNTRQSNESFGQSGDYAKSLQDLGAGLIAYAQSHMEKSVQAAQQLLNCRSLEDMAQVQSQYLQESFDTMVKETNKLAQNAANFAKKTAEPLNSQMEAMMQKFQGRS